MALLDVSELLLDPDFIDTIQLVHRTATVNAMGETVLVESAVTTVGSVQPATAKEFQRVPEALRMSDWRAFYVKAEILTDGSSQYPDLLVFGGRRYEIKSTEPWLNFGQGWNKGLCVAQEPSL